MTQYGNAAVAAIFRAYPPAVRRRLQALRKVILEVAAATPGVGTLTETLKWGQPSYLTKETGSGTTVRIDRLKGEAGGYAVYFHCRSGLIGRFRELYPDTFAYDGKRAIKFTLDERLPLQELKHCIGLALVHHLRSK